MRIIERNARVCATTSSGGYTAFTNRDGSALTGGTAISNANDNGDLLANSGTFAKCAIPATTGKGRLDCSDFNFGGLFDDIDVGETIEAVEVRVTILETGTGAKSGATVSKVKLLDAAGAETGGDRSDEMVVVRRAPTSDYSYQREPNLYREVDANNNVTGTFSATLTPSEVTDSDFGVRIEVSNATGGTVNVGIMVVVIRLHVSKALVAVIDAFSTSGHSPFPLNLSMHTSGLGATYPERALIEWECTAKPGGATCLATDPRRGDTVNNVSRDLLIGKWRGLFLYGGVLETVGSYTFRLTITNEAGDTDTTTVDVTVTSEYSQNYYVNTGGSNGANGSLSTPWATVEHAFTSASFPCIINVQGGQTHNVGGNHTDIGSFVLQVKTGTGTGTLNFTSNFQFSGTWSDICIRRLTCATAAGTDLMTFGGTDVSNAMIYDVTCSAANGLVLGGGATGNGEAFIMQRCSGGPFTVGLCWPGNWSRALRIGCYSFGDNSATGDGHARYGSSFTSNMDRAALITDMFNWQDNGEQNGSGTSELAGTRVGGEYVTVMGNRYYKPGIGFNNQNGGNFNWSRCHTATFHDCDFVKAQNSEIHIGSGASGVFIYNNVADGDTYDGSSSFECIRTEDGAERIIEWNNSWGNSKHNTVVFNNISRWNQGRRVKMGNNLVLGNCSETTGFYYEGGIDLSTADFGPVVLQSDRNVWPVSASASTPEMVWYDAGNNQDYRRFATNSGQGWVDQDWVSNDIQPSSLINITDIGASTDFAPPSVRTEVWLGGRRFFGIAHDYRLVARPTTADEIWSIGAVGAEPYKVTGLAAAGVIGAVHLTWDVPVDESVIDRWDIYRDGSLLDASVTESYSDTSGTPGQSYDYYVIAVRTIVSDDFLSEPSDTQSAASDPGPGGSSNIPLAILMSGST